MQHTTNLPKPNPFSYNSITKKMGRNLQTIKNKAVARVNSGSRSPSPVSRPQTPVSRPTSAASAASGRCCPCPAFKKGGRTRRRSRR